MNAEQIRDKFEAYMVRQNVCTRLHRHRSDDTYRTISVQRAWELWQAALATQPQAPQGAEIVQLRELLTDLVECVGRSLEDRQRFFDFEKYSNHLGFCRRPRGDQSCQCGYSSMRAGLDALLDECTGYQGTAAIDKARTYLANTSAAPNPETPEGKK